MCIEIRFYFENLFVFFSSHCRVCQSISKHFHIIMETIEAKRRIPRKKSATFVLPEDVTCQYSRLSNLLLHAASRKWLLYEWQYDEIDAAFFHKFRTFEMLVNAKFPRLKTHSLTSAEWRVIRRKIAESSKCRRFSPKFIKEQRIELEKYRQCYRMLKTHSRHDQLSESNEFHDNVLGFVRTIDPPQQQNIQLFRYMIELKKLFTAKRTLVAKLREINNERAEMQRQQQHTIVNGTADPITTAANATAIKVITKIQECNNQIMEKFKQMMCFPIVKDAHLINALKRKQIVVPFSPDFFLRVSAIQLHESQQLYRSETIVTNSAVQTFLDTMLVHILITIQYELMLKMMESVEQFAENLIAKRMDVLNMCAPSDIKQYFENICIPKLFEILNILRDLLE